MSAMTILLGIAIGALLGLVVSLDLILKRKNTLYGFVSRGLLTSLFLNAPQITKTFTENVPAILLELSGVAFLTFVVSILVGIFISYMFYLGLKRQYKSVFLNEVITYVDLFSKGYGGLQESIRAGIDKEKQVESDYNKVLLETMRNMGDDVPGFLIDIYDFIYIPELQDEPLSYSLLVLENFVSRFLSENSARFTIRQYDVETNAMVSIRTTKEEAPSPIPVNSKNMITKSMEMKQPLIYSRNQDFHFNTHKSLELGRFKDYVTYCLLTDASGNKPLFSVNLDVKDTETQNKMFAFVDTKIFQVVCEPIKKRLKEYAEKEGLLCLK